MKLVDQYMVIFRLVVDEDDYGKFRLESVKCMVYLDGIKTTLCDRSLIQLSLMAF